MDRETDQAVKETGILFTGEMVRAILRDVNPKTQTRRVCQGQLELTSRQAFPLFRCPYGQPGTKLWVRESWDVFEGPSRGDNRLAYVRYAADICLGIEDRVVLLTEDQESVMYRYGLKRGWKPSIHMPRWASRITLEVVKVRVERLQEISAKDIIAEGAVLRPHMCEHLGKCPVSAFDKKVYPDLKSLWAAGWNKINAKRGYGWDKNPWVWVIEFKKL